MAQRKEENHKLIVWEQRGKRTSLKIRSRIEHVFGMQAQRASAPFVK